MSPFTLSLRSIVIIAALGVAGPAAAYECGGAPHGKTASAKEKPAKAGAARYVGLTVADARALAKKSAVPFRVVMRDGKHLIVTRDYRPGRINAAVEKGVVTSASVEGAPKS
ncbi:MAG: hypothetical protein MRY74_08230 [Neomegalonema sp.]|nr:hypothetical protein [Neomegalonema sp.]